MGKSTPTDSRVELGQVRVHLGDATVVQEARVRLTRWLVGEPDDSDTRYRPPRMGAVLSDGQFIAWAVRYAIVRAEQGHRAWPSRILERAKRTQILQGRKLPLGACRVGRPEAKAFRMACLDFVETLSGPTESINQSKFLTLAVVGFAECVRQTAALRNLPLPPWSGQLLFH